MFKREVYTEHMIINAIKWKMENPSVKNKVVIENFSKAYSAEQ